MALKSSYLQDIDSAFKKHIRSLSSMGKVEFEEDEHELVTEELWEVVIHLHSVYVVLTVWGDQIATFRIRENAKKRMHRNVLVLQEFALLQAPEDIVAMFRDAASNTYLLSKPPDQSEADQEVLESIRETWLKQPAAKLH